MKPIHKIFFLLTTMIVVGIGACTKFDEPSQVSSTLSSEPILPSTPYSYNINGGWGSSDNNKATLGRVLFYDQSLSVNHTIACASCHKQNLGFADNVAFSTGFNNKLTGRNSMAIVNINPGSSLFWDLRENSVTSMVLKPIQNHIEMGFDQMNLVAARLNQIPYYNGLVTKAFGDAQLTPDRIAEALSQFVMALSSSNTRFDRWNNSYRTNNVLTALELEGSTLFNDKLPCSGCHSGNDIGGWGMANIGLDMNYKDKGATGWSPMFGGPFEDGNKNSFPNTGEGFFKIPSLRNIEYSAPYMHDGRFKTLEQVVDHYNGNIQNHKDLDWRLKTTRDSKTGQNRTTDGPIRWNLTQHEKTALVAYLKTFSDPVLLSDVKYSNPFQLR